MSHEGPVKVFNELTKRIEEMGKKIDRLAQAVVEQHGRVNELVKKVDALETKGATTQQVA